MFTRIQHNRVGVKSTLKGDLKLLKPGTYFRPWFSGVRIQSFPAVGTILRVPTQEIQTQDQVSVKISLTLVYRYEDATKMVAKTDNPQEYLINVLTTSIRGLTRKTDLSRMVAEQAELEKELHATVSHSLTELGCVVESLSIRDLILPRGIKNAYAAEASAKVEARARLEQARSQTAALRHLANAAELVSKQPELLQLLALQRDGDIQVEIPMSKK